MDNNEGECQHKMPFDGQGLTTKVVPSFCTFVDSGECTLCAIFLYFRRLRGKIPYVYFGLSRL